MLRQHGAVSTDSALFPTSLNGGILALLLVTATALNDTSHPPSVPFGVTYGAVFVQVGCMITAAFLDKGS